MGCSEVAIRYFSSTELSSDFSLPLPTTWGGRRSQACHSPPPAAAPGPSYLVKLLVELAELGHFLHQLLPHEEGRVEHAVALGVQHPEGVVDERLLQEHQRPLRAAETPWQRTEAGGDGPEAPRSPSGNNPCFLPRRLPSPRRSRRSSPPGQRASTSSGPSSPPRCAPPCCLRPARRQEMQASRWGRNHSGGY